MALKIYIVKGVCANAIHMFDTMFGIENKTMVLTLPIAEDTQPPPNEPIMKPITYEVAKEIRELLTFNFNSNVYSYVSMKHLPRWLKFPLFRRARENISLWMRDH